MKYPFTEKMQKLMDQMGIPFDYMGHLTDEQYFEMDDIISDYLVMHMYADKPGAELYGYISEEAKLCEDILNLIAETQEKENNTKEL